MSQRSKALTKQRTDEDKEEKKSNGNKEDDTKSNNPDEEEKHEKDKKKKSKKKILRKRRGKKRKGLKNPQAKAKANGKAVMKKPSAKPEHRARWKSGSSKPRIHKKMDQLPAAVRRSVNRKKSETRQSSNECQMLEPYPATY